MQAGAKVIVNREGDIWDGSEGNVLDPSTFGAPHISGWVLVQGCVEDEFGLRIGERWYPADALEVVRVSPDPDNLLPGTPVKFMNVGRMIRGTVETRITAGDGTPAFEVRADESGTLLFKREASLFPVPRDEVVS